MASFPQLHQYGQFPRSIERQEASYLLEASPEASWKLPIGAAAEGKRAGVERVVNGYANTKHKTTQGFGNFPKGTRGMHFYHCKLPFLSWAWYLPNKMGMLSLNPPFNLFSSRPESQDGQGRSKVTTTII